MLKSDSYLKIETENVTLNIDAPKKVQLKADIPLQENTTGMEYLSESPYGGTKTTKDLPSDDPAIINKQMTLRILTSPLNLPNSGEGSSSSNYGWKPPTKTVILEEDTDSEIFNEVFTDVKETFWPVVFKDTEGVSLSKNTTITLDTMLDEQLFSDMAYLFAIDEEYPGNISGFHTHADPEMDRVATVALSKHILYHSFWSFAKSDYGYVSATEAITIWAAYKVPILLWHDLWMYDNPMMLYDKREQFFNELKTDSSHPFMRYLARCRYNNTLLNNTLLAIQELDVTQPYYCKIAGLVFMTKSIVTLPQIPSDACCIIYANAFFMGEAFNGRKADAKVIDGKLIKSFSAAKLGIAKFSSIVCAAGITDYTYTVRLYKDNISFDLINTLYHENEGHIAALLDIAACTYIEIEFS